MAVDYDLRTCLVEQKVDTGLIEGPRAESVIDVRPVWFRVHCPFCRAQHTVRPSMLMASFLCGCGARMLWGGRAVLKIEVED